MPPPPLLAAYAAGRVLNVAEPPILIGRGTHPGRPNVGFAIPIAIPVPPLYPSGPGIAQGPALLRGAARHLESGISAVARASQRQFGGPGIGRGNILPPGIVLRRILVATRSGGQGKSADIPISVHPGAGNIIGRVRESRIIDQITSEDAAGIVGAGYLGNAQGAVRILPVIDQVGLGRLAAAFLGFPGKLKDAVDADAGDAGFPVSQPALLGRDKTAETAALPEIDGVIPLVAVAAGFPSLRLGKGVGLVNAAVEGLAPVFGQGFQDGGRAVVVGKGLPIGAVPGDGPGGLANAIPGAH